MITKTDTVVSKSLVERKILAAETLQPYLDEAARSKETLFTLLVKRGALPEDQLLRSASEALRLPFMELAGVVPEPGVIEKVPLKVAEYYKMAPLKLDKRKLTIAVSAPLDLRTQDDIRAQLGYEVEAVLARERDVQDAIRRFYGVAAGTIGEMVAQQKADNTPQAPSSTDERIDNIDKLVGDASIAKLVNQIILEAHRKRATDIHIEPYRGKVKLRYRIDGILYDAHVPPEIARFIQPILSRIKIMSNLNIVEKRMPQDGRAIVKVEETTLDLRVSCIPTSYGESVVIRMLPLNRIFNIEQLGMNDAQKHSFEELINKPHGIIFITGPTGSGKSTTLYACLNGINTDDRKIITIEDPVEYEMEGVTQIQVATNIGLDFARGLKSILRHDPDVIMVGEVRDLETAETAIRVALTGHLVLSTLHTNDAASGVTRLLDIGVESYLVASSVEAFIAQRLVRVICEHCKEEDRSVTSEVKKQIGAELGVKNPQFKIYYGKGCPQCNSTGFWGRRAIYEVLLVTEEIKELIMKRATAGDIKKMAVEQGMRTLRQDGWQKVIAGSTTAAEIFEATQGDKEFSVTPDPSIEAAKRAEPDAEAPDEKKLMQEHGRFFMRLNQTVNIHYKLVKAHAVGKETDKKLSEEYSFTKNISAGGLLFVAHDALSIGTILEITIELPGEDSIGCLAKVTRQDPSPVKGSYDVAVCFLDLSAQMRARLQKFVVREMK